MARILETMPFDFSRVLTSQIEGKALAPHPAFMDRTTPVTVYAPGKQRQDSVLSQREALHHAQAFGGREAIDWVYDCIGLYSDPAASSPFRLTQEDGTKLVKAKTKGTPPDHNVGPADLFRLLEQPNPFMLYDELMALLVIDLMLVGNAYWLKWQTSSDGKPLALYRLAPGYVKVKPGQYGPLKYIYQPPGAREPMEIKPENLIHFRRPNPHSAYYGMGVIQGAGRSMDLEIAITDTMASYYENKADPSLIIESERRVPRDVFNKLRAQLRARTSGSSRAGELLLLEAGLKASSLSVNARDALFNELARMSRDRIFTKFRASPALFGLMDETGSGGNKVSDYRREFDNYTLRPFLDRLAKQITFALTAAWGVKLDIDYRTLLPPDDALKIASGVASMPYVKVREVRRQYAQFGIEESTGDPKIDEKLLNEPTPNMDANGQITLADGTKVAGQKVGADRALPGEPGRPPLAKNTRNPAPQGKSLAEIEAYLDALEKGEKAVNVSVGNVLPGEQRPSDPYASARQLDIDAATASMAAQLRDAAYDLERALLDTVDGKALKTSDIVKRMRQASAWQTFKERVQSILEEGARQGALSAMGHYPRNVEDEIDVDEVVKAVIHRPDGGLRTIMKTFRDRVAAKMKDVRDADGERADFHNAIRAAVADWSSSQAVTIADSEATEAYNEATLTVLETAGESQVYVTDGDESDEPCIEANGQVWDIATARQNRKEHPRCRRAFLSLSDAADAGVL